MLKACSPGTDRNDDPATTPRTLGKAALAFRQAGNTEEADRLSRELHKRYPNYAGG
jgi:TolA-binding protein